MCYLTQNPGSVKEALYGFLKQLLNVLHQLWYIQQWMPSLNVHVNHLWQVVWSSKILIQKSVLNQSLLLLNNAVLSLLQFIICTIMARDLRRELTWANVTQNSAKCPTSCKARDTPSIFCDWCFHQKTASFTQQESLWRMELLITNLFNQCLVSTMK